MPFNQQSGWLSFAHLPSATRFPQAAVLATARWMCCAGVASHARPRAGEPYGKQDGNIQPQSVYHEEILDAKPSLYGIFTMPIYTCVYRLNDPHVGK